MLTVDRDLMGFIDHAQTNASAPNMVFIPGLGKVQFPLLAHKTSSIDGVVWIGERCQWFEEVLVNHAPSIEYIEHYFLHDFVVVKEDLQFTRGVLILYGIEMDTSAEVLEQQKFFDLVRVQNKDFKNAYVISWQDDLALISAQDKHFFQVFK